MARLPEWHIIRPAGQAPSRLRPLSSNVRQRNTRTCGPYIAGNQAHLFESATSTQTLAEGLAEYYAANPQLKRGDSLSPQARQFFHSHDVVHVLYGCGTSMPDEAIVKLASIFGTTGGMSVLRGYLLHETLEIYTQLPFKSTVAALLSAPYLIIRTLWRCKRQPQSWPWQDHQQYLSVSLVDLRARFGIRAARTAAKCAA